VGSELDYQLNLLPTLISNRVPNLHVRITSPVTNIEEAINMGRQQYHSTRVMAILENQDNLAEYGKILGITSIDLYNPSPRADGTGFVFGEARLPGRSGLVSTFRLSARSPNSQIFDARVKKEVVHELGHMVGLEHCSSPGCVMNKSTDVSDTDAKPDDYCAKCTNILKGLRH
jgi:archaemetzincin